MSTPRYIPATRRQPSRRRLCPTCSGSGELYPADVCPTCQGYGKVRGDAVALRIATPAEEEMTGVAELNGLRDRLVIERYRADVAEEALQQIKFLLEAPPIVSAALPLVFFLQGRLSRVQQVLRVYELQVRS